MRPAICRAAIRRGSNIRIFPLGKVSSIVSGKTVDLPAPGGAVTTSADSVASSRFTSGTMAHTGRWSSRIMAPSCQARQLMPRSCLMVS